MSGDSLFNKVDVILLCGGRGKRLHSVTKDNIPKSLYEIESVELIKFTLEALPKNMVGRLIFSVGHYSDLVKDWVLREALPYEIYFVHSAEGVLKAVEDALIYVREDNFIVCNTDEIRDGLAVPELLAYHWKHDNTMTMPFTWADNLYRHRLLTLQKDNLIIASKLKPPLYRDKPEIRGPINIGFIVINKSATKYFDPQFGGDWSAIIEPSIAARLCTGFKTSVRYFNVGTVQELEEAKNFLDKR